LLGARQMAEISPYFRLSHAPFRALTADDGIVHAMGNGLQSKDACEGPTSR
jgi:hypothetical protein